MMRYYSVDEEIKAAAPGRVLVHNHAPPAERSGTRGFRAWEEETGTAAKAARKPAAPAH